MERRLSKRKPVDVEVYLSDGGQPLGRFTASDISGDGVYLKANPLDLPRGKPLSLLFALSMEASNVVRLHRVSAVVARSENDGVGMRFCRKRRSRS
ncbi:MAG TPA: PilZ domain-containing protein [Gammaproteobacteria bacterium]|nr:PilZ domain-containing protein [Gammaproteobacteria bacterium]